MDSQDSLYYLHEDMLVYFPDNNLATYPKKVRDNNINIKLALEMNQFPKYNPDMSYLPKMYNLQKDVAPKYINRKEIDLNLDIANLCHINHKKEQLDLAPLFNLRTGIKGIQQDLEDDPVSVYYIERDDEIKEEDSCCRDKKLLTRHRRNQLISQSKKCNNDIPEGSLADDEDEELRKKPAPMSALSYSGPDRNADFIKATRRLLNQRRIEDLVMEHMMRNCQTSSDDSSRSETA